MSSKNQKIIGTLVPIRALSSSKLDDRDQGTFAVGFPFLTWLKKTGQSAWQILPIHQTELEPGSEAKRLPSPYKGYGIGLSPRYLSSEFAKLIPTEKELKLFVAQEEYWIEDYALFCALSEHFGTDDWRKWDKDLRRRKREASRVYSEKLSQQIHDQILLQWRLHKEYKALRKKAQDMGIILIGDLPYYVSVKSPLVWAHQDIFRLNRIGQMRYVSGIPDSPHAHFGKQVWGHPLYKWGGDRQNLKVLAFWEVRLRYLSLLFDEIRFDHAKAIFDYGEIDLDNNNADRYRRGPGDMILKKLINLGRKHGLSIFAEDSGDKLKELRISLQKLNVPGIKILRFAFNEKKVKVNQDYAEIANYPKNTVAYITTHDTETLMGYLGHLKKEQKIVLATTAGVKYMPDDKLFAKVLRDAVISSPARIVIVPMQDWLLTTDRINIPGTEKEIGDTNWQYKLSSDIEDLPVDF